MTKQEVDDLMREILPVSPLTMKTISKGKEVTLFWHGIGLQDYFAAQYMSAGKLPDEAFQLARIAMKEREAGV